MADRAKGSDGQPEDDGLALAVDAAQEFVTGPRVSVSRAVLLQLAVYTREALLLIEQVLQEASAQLGDDGPPPGARGADRRE